jgi:hypothetical protein
MVATYYSTYFRQDHRIIFYDTTNTEEFKKLFQFKAAFAQWTITDYAISPNNRFLAYSSLVPCIHLAEISNGTELIKGKQRILPLCDEDQDMFAVIRC